MDDDLAAIAREIFGSSRSSSPILKDVLTNENEVEKYMAFQEEEEEEEEGDVKIEIKNDDVLSMTAVKNESDDINFRGFELSLDPNAFEHVLDEDSDLTQQQIDSSKLERASNSKLSSNVSKKSSNSKQRRKRGRRPKTKDKEEEEEEESGLNGESPSVEPESPKGLDIDNCFESPFDDYGLNNPETTETTSKSSKDSSQSNTKPPLRLRVNLKRLSPEKSSEENVEELPLKRTRRKVNLEETSTAPSETELEMGHRILKQLMSFPGSAPFLDRPDFTADGMNNYYVVVKKPMWLKYVLKKYNEEKYPSITELVADIRLVLENCYLYWGTGDPLTKKALRVEELLEKKLATLPAHVRELCSLEATHGEDETDNSERNKTDNTNQKDDVESSSHSLKKGVFVSRLLQRVINNSETDSINSENSVLEGVGIEVEEWEKSVLYRGNAQNEIDSMWELPLIGQFLSLTLNILSIGQISQHEIERMLLIPQASTVLAKLMTSMLVTPFCRVKLEEGPPMPYEFWSSKLKKKVSLWYHTYRSTGGVTIKVFERIGIEPEFWLIMGEINPLEEMEFHELKFIQRVWVLKSLCDFLLHNHKSFQESFNVIEPDTMRESYLGRDRQGFSYHYFPEFNEVRIYKRARVSNEKWNEFEHGVEEMIFSTAEDVDYAEENEEEDGRLRYKLPRSLLPSTKSFKMVARCVEDVRSLLAELAHCGTPLLRNLRAILAATEPLEAKIESANVALRNKMHKEWLDFINRPVDYVDPGASYWSKKELKDKEEKTKDENADSVDNIDSILTVDKRERRSVRENQKYLFDELEQHLGPEEDGGDYEPAEEGEDSEDEWVATPSKKKKKQQNVSQRKIKKLQTLTQKLQDKNEDDTSNRTGVAQNIQVPKIPAGNSNVSSASSLSSEVIVIKDEPLEPSSSNNLQGSVQPKSVSSQRPPPPPPAIPLQQYVQNFNLKKEATESGFPNFPMNVKSEPVQDTKLKLNNNLQSDVINLLSDEEDVDDVVPVVEDVKPVIKTIECFMKFGPREKGAQQNPTQAQTLQQLSMMQAQFEQETLNGLQTPPQQMMPQASMVFQQRANIVQPPQQMAQFPNSNTPLPPTNRLSQPIGVQQFAAATVKQEPGTVPPAPSQAMFNSPSPQQQSPRMMQSPPMMRGSPQIRGSPSPRARMMTSPRMLTSPRMVSSPRMMTSPTNRSPMLQRGGRMPMPTMGRGSPQNMRQRSPQTFPQRGNITSPNFNSSPQRNNQVRRNLNFNSNSRPQPSNQQQSMPAAANSSNRPKERLHIINAAEVVGKNTKTVEGKLVVSLNDDGNYGYFAVLSDGGKVTVSMKQINELRSKCNGSLPDKVGMAMVITD